MVSYNIHELRGAAAEKIRYARLVLFPIYKGALIKIEVFYEKFYSQ